MVAAVLTESLRSSNCLIELSVLCHEIYTITFVSSSLIMAFVSFSLSKKKKELFICFFSVMTILVLRLVSNGNFHKSKSKFGAMYIYHNFYQFRLRMEHLFFEKKKTTNLSFYIWSNRSFYLYRQQTIQSSALMDVNGFVCLGYCEIVGIQRP